MEIVDGREVHPPDGRRLGRYLDRRLPVGEPTRVGNVDVDHDRGLALAPPVGEGDGDLRPLQDEVGTVVALFDAVCERPGVEAIDATLVARPVAKLDLPERRTGVRVAAEPERCTAGSVDERAEPASAVVDDELHADAAVARDEARSLLGDSCSPWHANIEHQRSFRSTGRSGTASGGRGNVVVNCGRRRRFRPTIGSSRTRRG
jgi:hypothetical protein